MIIQVCLPTNQCTRKLSAFSFLYILTSIYALSPFDSGHLTGVRYYITVVLICSSLMISNVEQLFMYMLTITCL